MSDSKPRATSDAYKRLIAMYPHLRAEIDALLEAERALDQGPIADALPGGDPPPPPPPRG